MASTYSLNLKIELMSTGENSGTWGTITNTNLGTALEQAIVGYGNPVFASDANLTLTLTDSNASQAARALVLNVTSSVSLSATREMVVPTIQKQYIVQNNTTGAQSITVKTASGTGITIPNGRKAHLYVDGTNVIQMFDFVDINGGTIDGASVGANSPSTGSFTTLDSSGTTTLNGTTIPASKTLADTDSAQTLSNKRVDPRVSTAATAATLTPNIASFDQYCLTALNQALGIDAPIGTPVNGNKLIFRILDDGTSRALTWDATYTPIGVVLPTATTISKMLYVGCLYNAANTRWDVVAVTEQA